MLIYSDQHIAIVYRPDERQSRFRYWVRQYDRYDAFGAHFFETAEEAFEKAIRLVDNPVSQIRLKMKLEELKNAKSIR